jgi:hypothetical protein
MIYIPMTRFLAASMAALFTSLAAPSPAQDVSLEGLTWTAQKCALYQRAVSDALGIIGYQGISDAFLAENAAFIEGGCVGGAHICPRSDQEYEFANMLTIMTMNEGMASTFVPFGCPN